MLPEEPRIYRENGHARLNWKLWMKICLNGFRIQGNVGIQKQGEMLKRESNRNERKGDEGKERVGGAEWIGIAENKDEETEMRRETEGRKRKKTV